jgi:hypothetical protein
MRKQIKHRLQSYRQRCEQGAVERCDEPMAVSLSLGRQWQSILKLVQMAANALSFSPEEQTYVRDLQT